MSYNFKRVVITNRKSYFLTHGLTKHFIENDVDICYN